MQKDRKYYLMQYKYLKVFFFFVISSVLVFAQEQKPIDKLSKEYEFSLIRKGLFEEVLLLNMKLVEKAKKNNDEEAIALGYIRIASVLCNFGENLESLRYLDLANNIVFDDGYDNLKIRVLANYGRNYSALKINKKAVECFDKSIEICKNLKSYDQNLLSFLYINKADAFLDTQYETDSTLVYLHKAIKIKENPFKYAVVANYYLKENVNIDSAKVYLDKSKVLILGDNNITEYYKATVIHADANFNKAIGNYKKAIVLYKESLNIYKKIKKIEEVKLSHKLISETYSQLNDEDNSHKYLISYTKITDSINARYNQNIDVVIGNFLSDQEKEYQKKEKKYNSLIVVVITFFLSVVLFIVYNYRKKRRKIIEEKEQIINQKNIESKKLKQKLNVAFDEVILLAKKNDSSFLVRFQEVYPNVCEKLLENNPKLVNTELTLCAMVWLNFSSKDIASYTNVQPKTVQTKKYRLRKKLNIPENINIYTWLKNL